MAASATVARLRLLGPLQMTIDGTPGAGHPQATGRASHVGHQPQQARRTPQSPPREILGRTSTYVLHLRKLPAPDRPGWCCRSRVSRLNPQQQFCDLGRLLKPRACIASPAVRTAAPPAAWREKHARRTLATAQPVEDKVLGSYRHGVGGQRECRARGSHSTSCRGRQDS